MFEENTDEKVLTEADFETNPTLGDRGFVVGDKVADDADLASIVKGEGN